MSGPDSGTTVHPSADGWHGLWYKRMAPRRTKACGMQKAARQTMPWMSCCRLRLRLGHSRPSGESHPARTACRLKPIRITHLSTCVTCFRCQPCGAKHSRISAMTFSFSSRSQTRYSTNAAWSTFDAPAWAGGCRRSCPEAAPVVAQQGAAGTEAGADCFQLWVSLG